MMPTTAASDNPSEWCRANLIFFFKTCTTRALDTEAATEIMTVKTAVEDDVMIPTWTTMMMAMTAVIMTAIMRGDRLLTTLRMH